MKKLTIAIDGHASTGKSSIAKELAVSLGYTYINSGSMYRACLLYTSPSPRDMRRSRMPSSA